MGCPFKEGDKVVSDVRGCKVQGTVTKVYGNGFIDLNMTHPAGLGQWKMVNSGGWEHVAPMKKRCSSPPKN